MDKEINVGLLWLGGDHNIEIKKLNDDTFVNPEDEIKDWVHCLNNPWSGTSIYYEVHPNYQGEGWISEKTVIVYDFIEAKISATGNTPQEAITACEETIKVLTDKYYEEEDDADSKE